MILLANVSTLDNVTVAITNMDQACRGDLVLPIIGAANRDPEQFEAPDSLDLRRHPNRHLAFGFNVHFCLGAPLGRLEAQVAIETIISRLVDLRFEDEAPRWRYKRDVPRTRVARAFDPTNVASRLPG